LLEDLLRNREKMLKLFWVGLYASIAFLMIGYLLILMDLFG
jgi:hypothetical protein